MAAVRVALAAPASCKNCRPSIGSRLPQGIAPAVPAEFARNRPRWFISLGVKTMADVCQHMHLIRDVTPSARGCEDCLKTGATWIHLRLCRICGHVGCCDDSLNRHARAHFHATGHPIIEGYDPPEGWGWCYLDEVAFDLSDRKTPHNGPIPRYY